MRFVVCLKAEPPIFVRTHIQGLPISIEARRGTTRHGRTLPADYGRIPRTKGMDGEAVDIFLGREKDTSHVYIVTKMKAPDFIEPDEQKVLVGFQNEQQARQCFLQYYEDERSLGPIVTMPIEEFTRKVRETWKKPGLLPAT